MKLILYFLMIVILVSCQNQPTPRVRIPHTEIVYQTTDLSKTEIGFVNSDGSSATLISLGNFVIHPVWFVNGNKIIGLARDGQSVAGGTPAYWDLDGNSKLCNNWYQMSQIMPFNPENETQFLIVNSKTIHLVDLETCEILSTFVDYSSHGELLVRKASYFPKKHLLLYGFEEINSFSGNQDAIIEIDVLTGLERKIGTGVNPSWSPDGAKIAYVLGDGIYVMDMNGLNSRNVVKLSLLTGIGAITDSAPLPSWSPDGKWLVYDRCSMPNCSAGTDFDIYKVEIETGIEYKIIEHGVYPDWKKATP